MTVQSLAFFTAETIGPFPGGLIRAGHALRMETRLNHSGIGTGTRGYTLKAGGSNFLGVGASNSGALLKGRFSSTIDVLSDSSATHSGSINHLLTYNAGVSGVSDPTVDFSAPWSVDIVMRSAAETAVNISDATWSGGVATFTSTAHTLNTGDKTTVAAVTPSGYNGVHIVTRIDANTFTAPIASNPGTYTSGGNSSRISNMISESYVLEWKG